MNEFIIDTYCAYYIIYSIIDISFTHNVKHMSINLGAIY